ncbi:MAG: NAD(+) synthase, partial [Paludibacteraceae bacterium]|nr:NAD(+) synthase [Paludibacteraceae bacterium]
MKRFGFVRVAAAVPSVKVADCMTNAASIVGLAKKAENEGVQIVCFPELSVTAYTCADLFASQLLISKAEEALRFILRETENLNVNIIAGLPVVAGNSLYNCAVIMQHGVINAIVPKTHLPSYNEFYETRWFASAIDATRQSIDYAGQRNIPFGTDIIISCGEFCFSTEICEDLWTPIPPSSSQALAGSDIIFNLSASNELVGKHDYLLSVIRQQSARCIAGYVYASSGFGESSTDVLFAGNGIVAENGNIIAQSERFSLDEQLIIADIDVERIKSERQKNTCFMRNNTNEQKFRFVQTAVSEQDINTLLHPVEKHPFIPVGDSLDSRCEEIFNIQVNALATRLHHTGIKNMVVGVSGGLDSTLALLVCAKTADKLKLDRSAVVGITMPGFGTTGRTYNNAVSLIKNLGATFREISIKDACLQHFKDISHDPAVTDTTYENSQARERTQILMDVSNQMNGLVIGTGDLSELALGWATYNGDQMSMYGVNASIPKTLVRHLVKWIAETKMEQAVRDTLLDIVDTPVSPELLPADSQGN